MLSSTALYQKGRTGMRRLLLVFAALAVMALMMALMIAPAFANNGHPDVSNNGIHSQGEIHPGQDIHPVDRQIGHLYH